jgi:hypothetical protein
MGRRVILCALALGVVTSLALKLCAGESAKQPDGDKEKAMMEAWLKHATPGDAHQKLQPLVGQWTYTGKMWMDPSKPPTDMKGGCERKWILGNRFVEEHFTGEFFGTPFHGIGTIGYDNTLKQYVSSWVDNASTSITLSTGSIDATGNVITMTHECNCPIEHKPIKNRDVIRIVSDDKHELEMYKTGPDGKEVKMMEFTLTRVGK